VGELEVDLRLEPRPEGTALRGDILDLSASADPRPVAGCRVRVPGGGEALTDEAGAFLLEGAGTDPWLVEFAWRGRAIRIALSDPTAPPQ